MTWAIAVGLCTILVQETDPQFDTYRPITHLNRVHIYGDELDRFKFLKCLNAKGFGGLHYEPKEDAEDD